MDIIERLKKNEKPFTLMDKELQVAFLAERFPASNIECLQTTSTATKQIWLALANYPSWDKSEYPAGSTATYRLRQDYQSEPEIIECKIEPQGLPGIKQGYVKDSRVYAIHQAMDDPNFVGFKFEDGMILPNSVQYDPARVCHLTNGRDLGDIKVKHATHVLFRKDK